jgi:2-dehydro-3-deoxy-D-arabinonate dehydratase
VVLTHSMYLTRHQGISGARWALNGEYLPAHVNLDLLLELPGEALRGLLESVPNEGVAHDPLLPPLEPMHEVWAGGVTYLSSEQAREAESGEGDLYARVYVAERPELFLKAVGWRAVGHGHPIRIRKDSHWDVPEPELVLVINRHLEVVGYTAGNDVSSREIEGENSLYLPQAKIYDGSCALGPGILLDVLSLRDLSISMIIRRSGEPAYKDETSVSQMKRGFEDLVTYLGRELSFPQGAFLMTGTGLVPPDDFTLRSGDEVKITVGELTLENEVA